MEIVKACSVVVQYANMSVRVQARHGMLSMGLSCPTMSRRLIL